MVVSMRFLRPYGRYTNGDVYQLPYNGFAKELVRQKIAQVIEEMKPEEVQPKRVAETPQTKRRR